MKGKKVLFLLGFAWGAEGFASGWSSAAETEKGKSLFAVNCASCHGIHAQGTKRKEHRSPPALNGHGHVTHHPPQTLLEHIRNGGKKKGEWMPAFGKRLSDKEQREVLYYLYTLWPEKVRKRYGKKFAKELKKEAP